MFHSLGILKAHIRKKLLRLLSIPVAGVFGIYIG